MKKKDLIRMDVKLEKRIIDELHIHYAQQREANPHYKNQTSEIKKLAHFGFYLLGRAGVKLKAAGE